MERDINLASACHDMLKQGASKNDVLTSILTDPICPKYSKTAFTLLDPDVESEEELYTPFRILFTFINAFYRVSLANRPLPLEIDSGWPAAVDPKPGHLNDTRTLTEPIRRDFFETCKVKLKFSPRLAGEPAHLKPDLVLMVHHDKYPNTRQPSVHWKDIRVPIEIKRSFESEGEIVSQLARYAGAMLMEQFDRKFAITVSLSTTQCRLFHWDSVGCHATEKIEIHNNPILFIRCIARLAMMTPAELGYDEHFSNAGRVLSDQKITTTLTVRESPIRQYLDPGPGSEEKSLEAAASMLLELDTENFLFESRGTLFHRYTRVWRGKEIEDLKTWKTGPTRVVKQSWAEATRPNEGYFYQLTNGIPTICSLVLMEECDHTWTYHNRVADQHVIGYLTATEKKPDRDRQPTKDPMTVGVGDIFILGHNPRRGAKTQQRQSSTALNTRSENVGALERVLLRFVFEEEHRPLSQAKHSVEVLEATAQWIEGLIALDRLGIVHRDISYSNLMLPAISQEPSPPKMAKIIDFGLVHLKEVQNGDEPSPLWHRSPSVPETSPDRQEPSLEKRVSISRGNSSTPNAQAPRAHHHITGTLPFIALELIGQLQRPSNTSPIEHTLRHDVESVFWVLFYFCHVKADPEPTDLMATRLRGLTSPDIGFVAATKSDILGSGRKTLTELDGPFWALGDFLLDFANYHNECYQIKEPIDAIRARDMAIEHRNLLIKRMEENSALRMGELSPPKTPPKPLAAVDSPKRKLATLEDLLATGEGEVLLTEDEVGTPRKKMKQDIL